MKTYIIRFSFQLFLGCLFIGCTSKGSPDITEEITAIENSLTKPVLVKGTEPDYFSIQERMKHYNVPGLSVAVVREGKLRWAKGYGEANTQSRAMVDTNTLFQAGSISKPLAALAALKLLEEGKVDLDTDVNSYLTDWKVEENDYTREEKVTLRRLLTHSAGMTVHGFPGYQQKVTFPSIEQVLDGKGNTPRIYVDTIPGNLWRYSGGGYTIMEKVVEDVSGYTLDEYVEEYIFQPLDMKNSTFAQPLPTALHTHASAAYDGEGKIIEGLWHNYPEQAAAGLWTTPSDLAKYCMEIQHILAGKQDGILTKKTVEMMLTKHKNDWGLGPSLSGDGDLLLFQHGGKNAGFTNSLIAYAHRGDAVIVMTNADNGGRLIEEILRSVSQYYDLGIREQQIVEIVNLTPDQLNNLTGKYKYEEQVQGVGDYWIEITTEDNKLIVLDPHEGERSEIVPLNESTFIDLEDGGESVFSINFSSIEVLMNGRFRFHKMD